MGKGSFSEKIIRFRWVIIIGFTAITAFFALQLPRLEIDPDMKRFLPDDLPSRVSTEKIEELFGGTEMLMILFKTDDVLNEKTLLRVKNIAKKVNRVRGVDKVLSLFDMKDIRGEGGAMLVNPACPLHDDPLRTHGNLRHRAERCNRTAFIHHDRGRH
jgi:predicted RND superfamily exporter protein